jgi:hypothetical protein
LFFAPSECHRSGDGIDGETAAVLSQAEIPIVRFGAMRFSLCFDGSVQPVDILTEQISCAESFLCPAAFPPAIQLRFWVTRGPRDNHFAPEALVVCDADDAVVAVICSNEITAADRL